MIKEIKKMNGYRLIYLPGHPRAMRSSGWHGWVYEHIVIAEDMLGRSLRNNECVHHLDGNRGNNRVENLLVLERGQHSKLHMWLFRANLQGWSFKSRAVSINTKTSNPRFCAVCGKTLQKKQKE